MVKTMMKIDEQRKFASELCKEVSGVYDSLSCYDDSELAGILHVEMDYMLKAANVIDQLSNELDSANQKLDAAINDLKLMGEHHTYCDTCIYCDCPAIKDPCKSCLEDYLVNNWVWKGEQNTFEQKVNADEND